MHLNYVTKRFSREVWQSTRFVCVRGIKLIVLHAKCLPWHVSRGSIVAKCKGKGIKCKFTKMQAG
jgi:hypothetical protein